jgi:hypothetical protein
MRNDCFILFITNFRLLICLVVRFSVFWDNLGLACPNSPVDLHDLSPTTFEVTYPNVWVGRLVGRVRVVVGHVFRSSWVQIGDWSRRFKCRHLHHLFFLLFCFSRSPQQLTLCRLLHEALSLSLSLSLDSTFVSSPSLSLSLSRGQSDRQSHKTLGANCSTEGRGQHAPRSFDTCSVPVGRT